jgi:hypothetical protein
MFLIILGISMVVIVLMLIFWRNYIRGAIFLIDNASQYVELTVWQFFIFFLITFFVILF